MRGWRAPGGLLRRAPQVAPAAEGEGGARVLLALLSGLGADLTPELRALCGRVARLDDMPEVALAAGLDAELVELPPDGLLDLLDKGPLLIERAGSPPSYALAWRAMGDLVQVLDPARGGAWERSSRLTRGLHRAWVRWPASAWRQRLEAGGGLVTLTRRMRRLGLGDPGSATADLEAWARLDAAVRALESAVEAGALRGGRDARRALDRLLGAPELIPERCWWARLAAEAPTPTLEVATTRALRAWRAAPPAAPRPASPPSRRPARASLGRQLLADGWTPLAMLAVALSLAALFAVVEAVLLRSVVEIGLDLGLVEQRAAALGALLVVVGGLSLLELPTTFCMQEMGQRVEARLRMMFFLVLPWLGGGAEAREESADVAERVHGLHALRLLPVILGDVSRVCMQMGLTAAAMIWLHPAGGAVVVALCASPVLAQVLLKRGLTDRDLRLQTHQAALGRVFLDAFRGLTALRAHGGQRAIQAEHRRGLDLWTESALAKQRVVVWAEVLQSSLTVGLTAWLVIGFFGAGQDAGAVLLLVYWALQFPDLGRELARTVQLYPSMANRGERFLRVMRSAERHRQRLAPPAETATEPRREPFPGAVEVELRGVSVRLSGQTLLQDVHLRVSRGGHVAIVGPSGAGKSTLLGLLLGAQTATEGGVYVDGALLTPALAAALRRRTAWVDPTVQLWDGSLLDNLRYGAEEADARTVAEILQIAELGETIDALPEGLQAPLGEGGARLSNGEGQRLRFGRAAQRSRAGLVLMDEAFRGLDGQRRRAFWGRARSLWRDSTLIAVTHDVEEALAFDRVLVIVAGRLVEDHALQGRPPPAGSWLANMRDAERELHAVREGWRRERLAGGALRPVEEAAGP